MDICKRCGFGMTPQGFSWPESALEPGRHSVCPPTGDESPYPDGSYAAAAWHGALG